MATSFSIKIACPRCDRASTVLTRRTGVALRLFCPACRHMWEQPTSPGPYRSDQPPPAKKR